MRLAFSPCPNDTFVFHAWTHGLLDGAPTTEVTYADIDVTNTAAERGEFDVVKVSYAALPWLLDSTRCCRAAARSAAAAVRSCSRAATRPIELDGARWRCPSERSTAYLLFRLWASGQRAGSASTSCRSPRSCPRCATGGTTPGWSSTRRGSPIPTTA